MTPTLTCEALREDLLALLYDDGDPAERLRARDHLAQCAGCRAEYSEFKGVRQALGGWRLPIAPPLPRPRPAPRWIPAALAAAAGVILGIGLAVAGRSAFLPVGLAGSGPSAASNLPGAAPQFVSYEQLQDALKTQESRYQAEIADLRRSLILVSEPSAPSAGGMKTASNLSPQAIERLLKASEERQARLFEARLAGLRTESELQRQYDMAQIAAGLAYIDSRTGADAARTSELMKNLVRVTAKPQDR